MTCDRTRLESLEEAVCREGEAAEGLSQHLRRTRSGAAHPREAARLGPALAEAKELADALNRSGSLRLRLTTDLARTLGLPAKSSLAAVARALGEAGAALGLAAGRLHERLEALARESAALSLFSRHGAAVAGHLAELATVRTVYGPKAANGRVRPDLGLAV